MIYRFGKWAIEALFVILLYTICMKLLVYYRFQPIDDLLIKINMQKNGLPDVSDIKQIISLWNSNDEVNFGLLGFFFWLISICYIILSDNKDKSLFMKFAIMVSIFVLALKFTDELSSTGLESRLVGKSAIFKSEILFLEYVDYYEKNIPGENLSKKMGRPFVKMIPEKRMVEFYEAQKI